MLSFRIALLLLAGLGSRVAAQTTNSNSWESVRSLTPGRPVEVIERRGAAIKGELSSVSADSLTVNAKHRAVVVLRSEVSTVRVRSGKRRRYALIGAAIGAGAGLGLGVAGSESLSNGGGGDLTNLKSAITVGSGAVGALMGAVIGTVVGNRATTVITSSGETEWSGLPLRPGSRSERLSTHFWMAVAPIGDPMGPIPTTAPPQFEESS